jgi:putative hydrolase of the HAD superfamily
MSGGQAAAGTLVRPRGLLLDAMGTLFGLREPVGCTYARVAAQHGIAAEPGAVEQAFRRAYRQAPPLAFPGLAGTALEAAELNWWAERIRSSLQEAAGEEIDPPQALVEQLYAHYAQPSAWQVYADVPERLERWRGAGLRLAVVSNFDSRLLDLLEGLQLRSWLQAVVVSSRAGAAKPSPQPFALALEQLQLRAHEVWHVGDSPEDVAGAQAAGVPCVLVRRP